jgi:hypothetical protein
LYGYVDCFDEKSTKDQGVVTPVRHTVTTAMFCTESGTLVEKDFLFCRNCGVKIVNAAKDQNTQASAATGV